MKPLTFNIYTKTQILSTSDSERKLNYYRKLLIRKLLNKNVDINPFMDST